MATRWRRAGARGARDGGSRAVRGVVAALCLTVMDRSQDEAEASEAEAEAEADSEAEAAEAEAEAEGAGAAESAWKKWTKRWNNLASKCLAPLFTRLRLSYPDVSAVLFTTSPTGIVVYDSACFCVPARSLFKRCFWRSQLSRLQAGASRARRRCQRRTTSCVTS